jgi:cardiolipin synthase
MWDDPEHPYADGATEQASIFDPLRALNFACLGWKRIACLYAGLIESSVRHVYITTPYFCPGSIVARAARQASGRGVDVRLLVP